jgi:hypothetical protein
VEGGFTWAGSISLMSLLVAVFGAGVLVTKVNGIKHDLHELKGDLMKKIKEVEDDYLRHMSEVRRNLTEKITDLKKDVERSSGDQGSRIGELEAKAREAKVRIEMTGRHAIPQEVK